MIINALFPVVNFGRRVGRQADFSHLPSICPLGQAIDNNYQLGNIKRTTGTSSMKALETAK